MSQMKWVVPSLVVLGVLALAFAADNPDFHKEQNGLVRHIVCFAFQDDAKPEQIQAVVDAFKELPNKIPFIVDMECGANMSPEGLNKGFTHCFQLTFKSAKDRDAYLPHPAHKEFGKSLSGLIKDVFVIDYFTKS
ncbi:MAG: Dabb family protein [bacterium]